MVDCLLWKIFLFTNPSALWASPLIRGEFFKCGKFLLDKGGCSATRFCGARWVCVANLTNEKVFGWRCCLFIKKGAELGSFSCLVYFYSLFSWSRCHDHSWILTNAPACLLQSGHFVYQIPVSGSCLTSVSSKWITPPHQGHWASNLPSGLPVLIADFPPCLIILIIANTFWSF